MALSLMIGDSSGLLLALYFKLIIQIKRLVQLFKRHELKGASSMHIQLRLKQLHEIS
jgi:hypothetical protein